MKRVLIITYYWPPAGGSGVQRWLKFSKYLPENGWKPVIYTPLNPDNNSTDESLVADILPGTEVVKRKIWEPYGFYKALTGKKEIKANTISDSSDNRSFTKRLSLWIRGSFFIPDPRCFWIRPSIRFLCRYLKEHPVDAIISTGPPHSMHLIAKGVSRRTGLPWIADFRDPWTEIFYFKHLNLGKCALNKHKRLEQSVLDEAKKVVVVSSKMQNDFKHRTSTPVEIITNGFDPADFEKVVPAKEGLTVENEQPFVLTHTGIFVDNGNPNELWNVLKEKAATDKEFARRLRIRLIGKVDDSVIKSIADAGLAANMLNMGYMPHLETIAWQKSAVVLLLPLRKEPEAAAILTGKFFEYIASGRKILAFGPVNGDLGRALAETGSGMIVDFEDSAGIKSAIDVLYEEFLKDSAKESLNGGGGNDDMERNKAAVAAAVQKYSRRSLAADYARLLDSVSVGYLKSIEGIECRRSNQKQL